MGAFIAAGGMGAVYRVWDLKRNAHLAMKVLHADLADDPAILKRFQREARALQKLAHPNIVPFYGLHHTDDFTFLLQLFVDGPTLKQFLRQRKGRPLPVPQTLTFLKALAAALGYAHAHNVVHSDVKPGNVLVDQGGSIYLTDFGIARHAESTLTTLGVAGSPAYMAPEQIRGEAVSAATDVYALGVMLFEMLTGRRPFRGDEPGTEESGPSTGPRIEHAHLHLTPPDPCSFNPDLPPALAQVLSKALAKQPRARYPTVHDLFSAVCAAVGVGPQAVQDRSALYVRAPQLSRLVTPPVSPAVSTTARRPVVLWTLAAGSLIILVLLGFAFTNAVQQPVGVATQTERLVPTNEHITGEPEEALQAQNQAFDLQTPRPETMSTQEFIAAQVTAASLPIIPTPTTAGPSGARNWQHGKMTFVARTGDSTSLYYLDLSGDRKPTLIYGPADSSILLGPVWSPNSNQIAYYDFDGRLQVITAAENQKPRVVSQCTQPYWSYDGKRIICKLRRDGDVFFEFLDAMSGVLINSFSVQPGAVIPALSPRDDTIAYAVIEDDHTSLWILHGGLPTLLTNAASENYAPAWSPDGEWIAYQSTLDSSLSEIWIIDRNGANARRLTHSPPGSWSRGPSWSPDGNWIAFVSNRVGSYGQDYGEIFVVHVDTGETHQVTNTGGLIYDWRVSWGK